MESQFLQTALRQMRDTNMGDVEWQIRAAEVLERVGTGEARELLKTLAGGNLRPRVVGAKHLHPKRVEPPST